MTKKDEAIIKDGEENGTPIFVLTAKDLLAVDVLRDYLARCIQAECDRDHVAGTYERLMEFIEWKRVNPGRVKYPD